MSTKTCTAADVSLVEECVRRVASDLALILERSLVVDRVSVERRASRPAGEGQVHVSFKFGVEQDGVVSHGCLLVPLPDALAIASHALLFEDGDVREHRAQVAPDGALRDSLLEVSAVVAASLASSLAHAGVERVCAEGCQGVRAGVRPALAYRDGDELLVGRARCQLHLWPAFEALLVLPALTPSAAPASS